jgi:multiple sugar transport system permease protein/cellobiose transport system permease protein
LYPTLYSFFISLTNWDSLAGIRKRQFVGFANYIQIFARDKLFFRTLGNTAFFMVINIPILISAGLLMAIALYKIRTAAGRRVFQTMNILPYITTPAAIGLIFSFMFDWSTGIVNRLLQHFGLEAVNWLGTPGPARFIVILMIVWKGFGYYMLIYLAAIAAIPEDVNEAALIDGANGIQIFFGITVPLLRPITVFLILTSIISGFQLYDEPVLLFTSTSYGGPERAAMTSIMYFYDRTFRSSTRLGYGAAISYTLFVVIILTSAVMSKILNRKEDKE